MEGGAKYFRRALYGLLCLVLTSYLLLFILVVSRHIDQGAQAQMKGALRQEEGAAPSDRQQGGVRRRGRLHACAQPKFRRPPGPVTALASFPGSGNTWIRFLVQQATGVLTGSVYRDYSLKRNGFPGESVSDGSVLLVKTHEWGEGQRRRFDRAVLLVRDPADALLAEFNRRAGGHVGHAAPHKFHKGNGWPSFVQTHAKLWMESVLDWLQFEGPLLVLRYEEVTADLPLQLGRLLRFLGCGAPSFQCALRHRDGIFRRPTRAHLDPYDESLRRIVHGYRVVVQMALLRYQDWDNVTSSSSNGTERVTFMEPS